MAEETHYFDDLRPRVWKIRGDHDDAKAREILENYFLALTHRYYGQGGDPERGSMDRADLRRLSEALGGTADHTFEAFCRLSAEAKGKAAWGEKTPRHVFRIDEILARYPNAKILCMIRDGRAVVTSYRDFKKGAIEEAPEDPGRKEALEKEQQRVRDSYHPIIASLLWRGVAQATRHAVEKHGEERVRVLRYEDLVADSPGEMAALCAWLGVDFDAERLSTVPIGTSSYADKVQPDAGVSSEAVARWRDKMSDEEVHTVEATSGKLLRYFEYALLSPKVSIWSRMRPWLTLPKAGWTAARANTGRHGGVFGFVMRRLRALR